MTCQDFLTHAPPLIDGELGPDATAAAHAHLAACAACRRIVAGEREFRQLMRGQPREAAPPELRARILARCRREARWRRVRPWVLAPALAAAAAAVALVVGSPTLRRPAPLANALVATHVAYGDMEGPAEFASAEPHLVEDWLQRRAGLRVTVADYGGAGIRLLGARVAPVASRKAAFVLYEKGHTLLSVFTVPLPPGGEVVLDGRGVTYRGQDYRTQQRDGYRTVTWMEGQTVFGLVSMLDYEALLECADRLRGERATRSRL
jgi:mycothiol system anti-sigma-R factor